MSGRITKAFESIQQGLNELSHLRDAYTELAQLVRSVADGKDNRDNANMVLRQHIKRDFLHSSFYIPYEKQIDPAVALLSDLLASSTPPRLTDITEEGWMKLSDDRILLARLCAEYPENVNAAIGKHSLRPWFIAKLFQNGSIQVNAQKLVFCVFGEAERHAKSS